MRGRRGFGDKKHSPPSMGARVDDWREKGGAMLAFAGRLPDELNALVALRAEVLLPQPRVLRRRQGPERAAESSH